MAINNNLLKVGIIGSVITALCCFTPVLVWLFAALGVSAAVGYLDYVLLPLLGVFIIILVSGVVMHGKRNKI